MRGNEVVRLSWRIVAATGFLLMAGGADECPGDANLVLTDAVISNASFEEPLGPTGARPPFWDIGWSHAPLTSGVWSLDRTEAFDGGQSLRLDPAGEYFASQILHVPGTGLAGQPISFRVRVKHRGLSSPPAVLMYAANPEITARDEVFDAPGFSASVLSRADSAEGVWHEVTGTMTSPTETTAVGILLTASGSGGSAWFDQVEIDAPGWNPAPAAPFVPQLPISARSFDIGFTSSAPMDWSEPGFENLIYLPGATGDLVNFFVPVRWCRLDRDGDGEPDLPPCETDPQHQQTVEKIQLARAAGLKIALTFNFTHASPLTVGELNPLSDGSSPGELPDRNVREALKAELLWLYETIDPDYVITGIEMNIMQTRHPTWWSPFVTMHGEIYDAIKAVDPTTHVTTYFTHEWAVSSDGTLDPARAAIWRMLLPNLDSIAFSSYPASPISDVAPQDYAAGYFARPRDIAPDLPILVAEFGVSGGVGSRLTELEQAEFLQRIIAELASAGAVAVVYYQPFDMNYFGQPPLFKDTWSRIGLGRLDGTAKASYFVWRGLFRLPR